MARSIYRACMYGWTVNAAGWGAIALEFSNVPALVLMFTCAAVAYFYWWAASRL